MLSELTGQFGKKIRVRVMGLLVQDNKLLLVRHNGIGEEGYLWLPPGGGVDYGESMEHALVREFREEVNLKIKVEDFLHLHEYLHPPLHAIELFFRVSVIDGIPITGKDPELPNDRQIIQELDFFNWQALKSFKSNTTHRIFAQVNNFSELLKKQLFC